MRRWDEGVKDSVQLDRQGKKEGCWDIDKTEDCRNKQKCKSESRALDLFLDKRVYNANDQQFELKKIKAEMLLRLIERNEKMGSSKSMRTRLQEELLNMIYAENEIFGKYLEDYLIRLNRNF